MFLVHLVTNKMLTGMKLGKCFLTKHKEKAFILMESTKSFVTSPLPPIICPLLSQLFLILSFCTTSFSITEFDDTVSYPLCLANCPFHIAGASIQAYLQCLHLARYVRFLSLSNISSAVAASSNISLLVFLSQSI